MTGWLTKELRIALGTRVWAAPVWGVLLALAGMAFFSCLGFWQLGRAAEKMQMISRYEARADSAPLPLATLLARNDIEDHRVRLSGRWDNARTVYLENQMRGPQAGFHVYTVFYPETDPVGILVNRGWVPVAQDMQRLPVVPAARTGRVDGTVAYPSAFFTVGTPDYRQRPLRVPRLDLPELSAALDVQLRAFVIRLDQASPDGFVREWQPASRVAMPAGKHRAYAFQWFSLALAVLVVLLVVNLRKNGISNNE